MLRDVSLVLDIIVVSQSHTPPSDVYHPRTIHVVVFGVRLRNVMSNLLSVEYFEYHRISMTYESVDDAEQNRLDAIESKLDTLLAELQRVNLNVENVRRVLADSAYSSRDLLYKLESRVKASRDSLPSEIVELAALRDYLVDGEAHLPALGGWPLGAPAIISLGRKIASGEISGNIAEFGGGASTIWIAAALRRARMKTRFFSIDHDSYYLAKTAREIEKHNLGEFVELVHAPIARYSFNEQSKQWYDEAALEQIEDLGLLIVDGPPGSIDKEVRLPSLFFAASRMRENAWVYLDDCHRPEEQQIAERWLEAFPGLTRVETVGETEIFTFRTEEKGK